MAKILFLEDEKEIIKILDEFLGKEGHELISATNSPRALKLIMTRPDIDLAILDIRIPGMDGIAVLRKVKSLRKKKPPLLILTGSVAEVHFHDNLRKLKIKEEDILLKPIDLYRLLEQINRKLEK